MPYTLHNRYEYCVTVLRLRVDMLKRQPRRCTRLPVLIVWFLSCRLRTCESYRITGLTIHTSSQLALPSSIGSVDFVACTILP